MSIFLFTAIFSFFLSFYLISKNLLSHPEQFTFHLQLVYSIHKNQNFTVIMYFSSITSLISLTPQLKIVDQIIQSF